MYFIYFMLLQRNREVYNGVSVEQVTDRSEGERLTARQIQRQKYRQRRKTLSSPCLLLVWNPSFSSVTFGVCVLGFCRIWAFAGYPVCRLPDIRYLTLTDTTGYRVLRGDNPCIKDYCDLNFKPKIENYVELKYLNKTVKHNKKKIQKILMFLPLYMYFIFFNVFFLSVLIR